MTTPRPQLVSLLHAQSEYSARATGLESNTMASQLGAQALDLPVGYSALVDPNDETIETEITEEMIELALQAVEHEQIWPFCADVPMKAHTPRPSAEVIRFPGC